MKFTVLEKAIPTLNPDKIINIVKDKLNCYLQDIYKEEELNVRKGSENKSETIIEVPIVTETYNDREIAAKDTLPAMKSIADKINDELGNQIQNFNLSVQLDKHGGKGKAVNRLTKISFSCSFLENKKQFIFKKIKIVSFNPSLEITATSKTVSFETVPFLIATGKIKVNETTRECTYNPIAKNVFYQMSENEIQKIAEKFNINPDIHLIEQGISIKNNLLPKIDNANYIIATGTSALSKEVKRVGVDLIKKKFNMNFRPDKFSTFDILFVKNQSFHKIFEIKENLKIEDFLNSFAALLSSFNTSPKFNYLGISMKKSVQSQAGKATTFFNEHLKVRGQIESDMKTFEMNNVDDIEVRTKKRKFLFESLKKEIKNKIDTEKTVKIELKEDKGFKDFWFSADDKQKIIDDAKLKNKQKKTPATFKALQHAQNIDIDIAQKLKYKSMLFVKAIFTTNTDNKPKTNFINMLHVALATKDTYNPSYFKIEGKRILAYNVKRMNMVLNDSNSHPIKIWFATAKQSEMILISIPVKLTIFDISGKDKEKTTDALVQFRCSKDGITPEVQSFHLSEKQQKIINQLISEKVQDFLSKI